MLSGTSFLIEQQRQKFQSDMTTWTRTVNAARRTLDAMRAARREPQRGPLLRGLSSITNTYRTKAMREIDRTLAERLRAVEGQEMEECYLLSQTFTDYPAVMGWMRSEQRRRAADRRIDRKRRHEQ